MWWTLGIIVIALVLFLVYKQRNNTVVDVQEEPQLEEDIQDSEETLPQIDIEEIASVVPNSEEDNTLVDVQEEPQLEISTQDNEEIGSVISNSEEDNTLIDVQEEPQLEVSTQDNEESLPQIDIEEVTSILPNLEEDNAPCEHTERNASNTRHAETSTNIEWTDELREVRRIMQLAPKKRKSILGNDTPIETKQYERYERLSVEEQYELAKQFAKLIEEADYLRNQGKLTEERSFCINAIKWCAKNGLSVIYWQCRLNQVNELLGKPNIKIDSVPTQKNKIHRVSPTQPREKKMPIEKNPLLGFSVWDFDNNISKLIQQKEFEQARALCRKMIDYANATKQERYREKAVRVLDIIGHSCSKKKKSKFIK